jgi:hypothetical protein
MMASEARRMMASEARRLTDLANSAKKSVLDQATDLIFYRINRSAEEGGSEITDLFYGLRDKDLTDEIKDQIIEILMHAKYGMDASDKNNVKIWW